MMISLVSVSQLNKQLKFENSSRNKDTAIMERVHVPFNPEGVASKQEP